MYVVARSKDIFVVGARDVVDAAATGWARSKGLGMNANAVEHETQRIAASKALDMVQQRLQTYLDAVMKGCARHKR